MHTGWTAGNSSEEWQEDIKKASQSVLQVCGRVENVSGRYVCRLKAGVWFCHHTTLHLIDCYRPSAPRKIWDVGRKRRAQTSQLAGLVEPNLYTYTEQIVFPCRNRCQAWAGGAP
jgi:hypothetical protein